MPPSPPFIAWLLAYKYLAVYPLAVVEGPVIMLLSGFLVRLGIFEFLPIYLLLMLGDLTGDILWYFVGSHGARRFIRRWGRFFSVNEDQVERFETLFRKHDTKILFISKITMGFGFALATLMAAGAARVPFKKYLAINVVGGFIWTGLLMAAGYFLGELYTKIDEGLRFAFVAVMILFALGVFFGFGKYLRNRFQKSISK